MPLDVQQPLLSRRSGRGLLAVALLSLLSWLGARLVFSQFQSYDDEGYLLITVQQFVQGSALYDDVYTQYGPAYYLWQLLLHAVLGIPITHDATRIVTLVVWLACSALVAVPVWLLTRRVLLTALAMTMAFFHLTQLTYEPGHPQELCFPAALAAIDLALWRLVRHQRLGAPAAAAIGALVALSALTKVNVGAFTAGAITLGLVTSLRGSWRRRAIRAGVAVAALTGVLALMRGDLLRADIVGTVVIAWSALLAVLVVGVEDEPSDGIVPLRELAWCSAGFAAAGLVVAVLIMERGTSFRALIDGLIIWPSRMPAVFWRPLPVSPLAAGVGAILLLAAIGWKRDLAILRRTTSSIAVLLGPLAFMLSAAKAYGALFAFAPPAVWLILREPGLDAGTRAARRVLAFAAILLTLQAYPMPEGTQVVMGTVLFLPLALIAIVDSEREARGGREPRRVHRTLAQKATMAALLIAVVALIGSRVEIAYARATPLAMTGARAVRADHTDTARYWWLTTNLRAHCNAFLMGPGINSLHFWTGIPPISTLNATLWPLLFDVPQQERVLDAATNLSRLCVVWEPQIMNSLIDVRGRDANPLAVWMDREFEPLGSFDGWEFRVKRGSLRPSLYQARWIEGSGIALNLPALGPLLVTRVAVRRPETQETLGDTARNDMVLTDEARAVIDLKSGVDLSGPRQIAARGTTSLVAPADSAPLIVQMWARDGQSVAVPLVNPPKLAPAIPEK